MGDCKTRNETKQDKAETKRDATQQKWNETKKIINNKQKRNNFFLHETTIHKMPVAIEKPLKFTERFGYGRKK
jgi:hypothetical protein